MSLAPLAVPSRLRPLLERALSPEGLDVIERHLDAMCADPFHVESCSVKSLKLRGRRRAHVLLDVTLRSDAGERSVVWVVANLPAGQDDAVALSDVRRRAQGHASLRSFREPALHVPELDLGLFVFPLDPRLGALLDATGPDAGRILSACTGASSTGALECDVVRYQPGKRCVIRYRTVEATTYAKFYATDRRQNFEQQRTLWNEAEGAQAFRVPEPLGYDAGSRVIVCAEAPGTEATSWIERLETGHEPTGAEREGLACFLPAAARALAEFQRSDLRPARVLTLRGEAEGRRERAAVVGAIDARLGSAFDRVLSMLEEHGASGEDRLVPAHTGFRHTQLLVDGPRVWVFDWDGLSLASPALDAGSFAGRLRRLGILRGGSPELDGAAATFREAFLDAQPDVDPRRLALYEALELTVAALGRLRRLRSAERATAQAQLLLAEARSTIAEGV